MTASGLPDSRACSVKTDFSRSITAGSKSSSDKDAGLVAATYLFIYFFYFIN